MVFSLTAYSRSPDHREIHGDVRSDHLFFRTWLLSHYTGALNGCC